MALSPEAYESEVLTSIDLVSIDVKKIQTQVKSQSRTQFIQLSTLLTQISTRLRSLESKIDTLDKKIEHLASTNHKAPDSTRAAIEDHLVAALRGRPRSSSTTASAMYPSAGRADRPRRRVDSISTVTAMYPSSKDAPQDALVSTRMSPFIPERQF